jgi:hypothetical protein
MKTTSLLTLLLLLPAYGQQLQVVFRDAATAEQLAEQFRRSSLENPMKRFVPADNPEAPDPSVVNRVANLVETSDIISFNGKTTLVPKCALLKIPENYGNRVNHPPAGNAVPSWSDFYALNRGWITTIEIKRIQAQGDEPIASEVLEKISKSRNLIVATYMGGPISLLPPKEQIALIETVSQDTQP